MLRLPHLNKFFDDRPTSDVQSAMAKFYIPHFFASNEKKSSKAQMQILSVVMAEA
jgi:hypothetical protein